MGSGADETGVDSTGDGGVIGAGNDGSAVGENCEELGKSGRLKFDEEGIAGDLSDGFEARGEFGEGEGERGMRSELNGVASAKGCGSGLSRGMEIEAFSATTGGAICLVGEVAGLDVTE